MEIFKNMKPEEKILDIKNDIAYCEELYKEEKELEKQQLEYENKLKVLAKKHKINFNNYNRIKVCFIKENLKTKNELTKYIWNIIASA